MARQPKKIVREDTYAQTKQLLELDLRPKQIREIVGISLSTISRIDTTEDFEDYRARRRAENEEQRKLRNGITTPSAKKAETKEAVTTKTLNELSLSRIANALERLADAWENTPSRKGLFK